MTVVPEIGGAVVTHCLLLEGRGRFSTRLRSGPETRQETLLGTRDTTYTTL